MMFEYLAKQPPSADRTKTARKFWKASREYDFSDYQLYCDKALLELGLARKGKNDYGDDDVLYWLSDYEK